MSAKIRFYESQMQHYTLLVEKYKKRVNLFSLLRLLTALSFGLLAYLTYEHTQLLIVILLLGFAVFTFLLKRHGIEREQLNLNRELLKLNREEIECLNFNFANRSTGQEFDSPNHHFSNDIDLFGPNSFFQFLNRTGLNEGKTYLAQMLQSNNNSDIVKRQQAISELSEMVEWRQIYTATARLMKAKISSKKIAAWLKDYKPFLPAVTRLIPPVFSGVSLVLFILAYLNITSYTYLGLWFLAGLFITGTYVKRVNRLSIHLNEIRDSFLQYSMLLAKIEHRKFKASLLKSEKDKVVAEKVPASLILKSLSKTLDALDNRNNLFIALLGNGFLLWDLRYSYKIEKWINEHKDMVKDWFGVVSFFDAFNSLANLSFNYPDYSFPDIAESDSKIVIQAEQIGHPLIPTNERVASNMSIKDKEFFVITGANMAGKSTFLRTVSLYIVMANTGLPVSAKASKYRPIKLITSMRTIDSLATNSSYFFAELKRLEFIIKELEKDAYFIVLDEILKGTNSKDKAEGSKKLIENLVQRKSTGIIATHDLSLCEIENQHDEVKNYYFETEIKNDELSFDYRLKRGVCKNMNASFLLRKLNIV